MFTEGDLAAASARSVVVDDTVQHRGVGRLLLGRLAGIAHENGFATLTADVLTGNAAMLGVLRALGLPQRAQRDRDVTTVVADVTTLGPEGDRRERVRCHIASVGPAVPSGSTAPPGGELDGRAGAYVLAATTPRLRA